VSEHEIEVKQHHRRNQEIGLIDVAKLHCCDPLPPQQEDAAQHHAEQENDD
jgi:hypothetical protein